MITPNCYDGNSTISSSMPTSPISSPTNQDEINHSKENQSMSPTNLSYSQYDDVILKLIDILILF